MNKEFKKTFFTCLLSVLLVVSNIVAVKYTSIFNVVVGIEFVIYPFTFLCTLLIMNLGDKKDAYRGILVAGIIQLLICISYVLITSLGSQTLIPDKAEFVNVLFKVNETNILASVLAFIVSHCSLIYLYDSFKKVDKELYGLVISLLSAMIINSIIFLIITLSNVQPLIIVDILLANVIIAVFMSIVITILFYILKEKELKCMKIDKINPEVKNDLNALELIEAKKIKNVKENKSNKNTKTKNYSKVYYSKKQKSKVDNKEIKKRGK